MSSCQIALLTLILPFMASCATPLERAVGLAEVAEFEKAENEARSGCRSKEPGTCGYYDAFHCDAKNLRRCQEAGEQLRKNNSAASKIVVAIEEGCKTGKPTYAGDKHFLANCNKRLALIRCFSGQPESCDQVAAELRGAPNDVHLMMCALGSEKLCTNYYEMSQGSISREKIVADVKKLCAEGQQGACKVAPKIEAAHKKREGDFRATMDGQALAAEQRAKTDGEPIDWALTACVSRPPATPWRKFAVGHRFSSYPDERPVSILSVLSRKPIQLLVGALKSPECRAVLEFEVGTVFPKTTGGGDVVVGDSIAGFKGRVVGSFEIELRSEAVVSKSASLPVIRISEPPSVAYGH